ncbi:MAG: hypothetical protein U1E27_12355 [Kiritimatiellia bacterium]|nr:hypothetical protein [Kiritimatiellia bacterium]
MMVFLAPVSPLRAERPPSGAPEHPLFEIRPLPAPDVGAAYHWDRRVFRIGSGEELDRLFRRVTVFAGFPVLPFARVLAEAGWVQSETDQGVKGDAGLSLGLRAEVSLAEIVFRDSPVVGRKEFVGLSLETGFRRSETDLADTEFNWTEWTFLPLVRYEINRRGEFLGVAGEPTGMAIRFGLPFSMVRGDLSGRTAKERRNFGMHLGADYRWPSNWTTQFRANLYAAKDRDLSLGVAYHF